MDNSQLDILKNVFGYLPDIFKQQNTQTLLNQNGDQTIGSLSSLAVGFGNTSMFVDGSNQGVPSGKGGLWLGNTQMPQAPFWVDMKGNLNATSATISGKITGGTIDIGAGNNSFHVDAAGNMWLGNAVLGSAPFFVLNNGNVTVANLTATGGTITGLTINSSSGTNKIVLNPASDQIEFYIANVLKATLRATTNGAGGIQVGLGDFDIINNHSILFNETGAGNFARIAVNSSNQLLMVMPTATDQFFLKDHTESSNLFTVSQKFGGFFENGTDGTNGNTALRANGNFDVFDIRLGQGKSRWAFKDPSGNEQFSITPAGGGNTKLTMNGFDLRLTSTKNAIVPTADGFKSLYCIEAPEVWFMDFCESKEKIDPTFLAVTEGEMRFIQADIGYQVWRRRKGHANKRFETKTHLQFLKNEAFLRMAK